MLKHNIILLMALVLFSTVHASEDYWHQYVHYNMDVTLLPVQQALIGEETIEYKNNSPDTLYKFYLHLYPNAYRDSKSIRAQEAKDFYEDLVPKSEDAGFIDIESFRILTKNDSAQNESITAFKINDTTLEAELPSPLPPGDELTVELSFYLKIRKFSGRAGYRGFQYDFAQWYPKVCVYDENGWNAQPFHYLGEFYGEFSTFDVTINVPYEFVVGATGVVVQGDPGWSLMEVDTALSDREWQQRFEEIKGHIRKQAENGKMRRVTFHAENVHDFAWVTSPDFLYESGEWDGIPIHVLYRSYVKSRWSRIVVRRSARALDWLSDKFGRYPYPQLTVVHGLLGGGMEYPMLVMNGSERETLILHEIGHIYFFGILANNEWKEAWLDEGLTTFQTRWYMETRYGEWGYDRDRLLRSSNWLQKNRPAATRREDDRGETLRYMNSGFNEPISKAAYEYRGSLGYRRNAYSKGAFFYDMLKHVVGDSVFAEICHEYFERWKFKHVNESRFKQVCEDVSGMDLDWFFEQWLHSAVTVDYALDDVRKHKLENRWQTDVRILRNSEGVMPVDIQLTTETGDTLLKRWDGFERTATVTFLTDDKPEKVVLDPEDAILDNSRFNNGAFKTKLVFEYPNMAYTPRDAFLITWRPSGWTNEVDKVRIGGRIKIKQVLDRNIYLGAWYGLDSREMDGQLGYNTKIEALGKRTRGSLTAQKLEGRIVADAHLTFLKSPYLSSPVQQLFSVGFNHSHLFDDSYTSQEYDQKNDITFQTWEPGDVNKLYFRYAYNPRGLNWFSNLAFGFDTVQEDWGSDFTYNTIFSELKVWFPKMDEGLFFRFYGKKIGNSQDAPVQDLIFLDGANPRQRFKHFYLRSHGALPEELHYHLPGGGNLRGFYNNPITGDQILAFNFELRKTLKNNTFNRVRTGPRNQISLVTFADVASMEFLDSGKEFFADAGVGLRLRSLLPDDWYTIFTGGRHLTIRLDFPLWVNRPLPDENKIRFRWVFGFEQAI